MNSQVKDGLLGSWKEIAVYLGRGVRTVQRWEHIGLPIHRIGVGARAPVWADAHNIDEWLQESRPSKFTIPELMHENRFEVLHESIRQSRTLRREMVTLRRDERDSLHRLVERIRAMQNTAA